MIHHLLNKQLFVLLLSVFLFTKLQAETKDQQTKVLLRTIGHEFLLQLGDSTSRILAIEKIDNRYAIQFEKEFSFEPDLISYSAIKIFEENLIYQSYFIEVEKCDSHEIVHSSKINVVKDYNMMTPCKGRVLPNNCYVFYFTEVIPEKVLPLKNNIVRLGSTYLLILSFLLFLFFIGVFIYFKKRKAKPNTNPDLINIGQYQFDQKGMLLTLKAKSIELSGKETDLLYLLFSNENKTLEREYILNQIWGDDGNYVGRTLDVFISKLRKKLEADPSLKIINIRGVGYRFVIG